MRVETGGWGGREKKNVDVRCIRILYASNMETVCENSEGGNGNTEVCENEKLPREVRVVQRMSPVLILSSELGPTGMWTSKIWPVRQEDRRGSRRLSAGSSRCAVGRLQDQEVWYIEERMPVSQSPGQEVGVRHIRAVSISRAAGTSPVRDPRKQEACGRGASVLVHQTDSTVRACPCRKMPARNPRQVGRSLGPERGLGCPVQATNAGESAVLPELQSDRDKSDREQKSHTSRDGYPLVD
jgi:hypothetical protein